MPHDHLDCGCASVSTSDPKNNEDVYRTTLVLLSIMETTLANVLLRRSEFVGDLGGLAAGSPPARAVGCVGGVSGERTVSAMDVHERRVSEVRHSWRRQRR